MQKLIGEYLDTLAQVDARIEEIQKDCREQGEWMDMSTYLRLKTLHRLRSNLCYSLQKMILG